MSPLFGGGALACLFVSLRLAVEGKDTDSCSWLLGAAAVLALLSIAAK